ncbi:MAG: PaaI family thioesterase [Dehalococcoidia bacterium]
MDVSPMQARLKGFFPDLMGLKLVSLEPDLVVAEITVRDDLCTVPGIMHGGAVMAFADTLGAVGTSIHLKPGHGTTTLESKTNFFSAGVAGTTLRAECRPLHIGGRTMVWQTDVLSAEGKLVAKVTQTQMVLEPRKSAQEQLSGLFEGKGVEERKALLATLERAGAEMYEWFAAQATDPAEKERLLEGARREIANAELLEG